jgi:hypothetical protein
VDPHFLSLLAEPHPLRRIDISQAVASWPRQTGLLPGPGFRSLPVAASMRTAASRERAVLSLSKGHPVVPLAHIGRGLRRDQPQAEPRAHISNVLPRCFIRGSRWPAPTPSPPLPSMVLDAGCGPTTNRKATTLGLAFFFGITPPCGRS